MRTCTSCGEENPERARFCLACGSPLDEAAPSASGEVRKTVTVVFTDVTDSTAIGERLDPETLRRLMTRYFDEMRDAIEAHGGVVEKFIGDAVMAVFGIPRVHEDDALRAVRAAAEMRERLEGLNEELERDRGVAIAIRTGVNTGEVVAGDAGGDLGMVTGDAVNVAARLEQAAAPGEILLGATTHALVRDAVDAEPVEPLSLKGKTNAVAAFRLRSVRPGATGHARRLDSPMVGRERQRRLLDQAFDQAATERVCYLFTVLGTAGVGKSRLVNEFLGASRARARIVEGRCLSYGEGITFWPLAETFRSAAGIADQEPAADALAKLTDLFADDPEATGIAAEVAGVIGLAAADAPPEEAFRAVRRAFEIMAARTPLVVVLDDIHWAQPAFLDLVDHVADWTRDAPILVICIARPELLETRPSWGGGKLAATTILLEPLGEDDSATLLANLLGTASLDDAVGRRIASAAEGNPLFVEEMLEMLIDDGRLVRRDGRWEPDGDLSDITVPPTIQALLAARLERLGSDERSVMERGSVEGKVFHRGAVSALAPDQLRPDVALHLMALVRKELVRPDRATFVGEEAFRFRHLLIRDAAYQAMPKETRAALHERFAAWLEGVAGERIGEYEEIVGYHLEQAYRYGEELGPVDERGRALAHRAAERLVAAGKRAQSRGDVRAALNLLVRATELLPETDPLRVSIRPAVGLLSYEAGEIEAAVDILRDAVRDADAIGDGAARARAEVWMLSVEASRSTRTQAEIEAEAGRLIAVFEDLGDEEGVANAAVVRSQYLFFLGRCADAVRIMRMTGDRARTAGLGELAANTIGWELAGLFFGPAPATEMEKRLRALEALPRSRTLDAFRFRNRGRLAAIQGRFDEARTLYEAWMDVERDLGRSVQIASLAGHHIGPLEMAAGRYPEAVDAFRQGYEALTTIGDRGYASTTAGGLAHALLAVGNDAEAERYARIALDLSTSDDFEPHVAADGALAVALARGGKIEEAVALGLEAVAIARGTDWVLTLSEALVDLGRVRALAGRRAEADAAFDEAIDLLRRKEAWALVERAEEVRASA